MADSKPTLHHMNDSQSQRILWLIEELSIPYTLENHLRVQSGPQKTRAPKELESTHPMGKAPQLVTAEGRVIAESSAIAAYLISTYDKAGKFKGDEKNDWVRDESLTSLAGSSLGLVTSLQLFFDLLTKQTPFLLRPLVKLITGAVQSQFTVPEMKKMMGYLDGELGDQDYFMGKEPGRADFMMSWPMDMMKQGKWVDLEKWPKLKAWQERCQAREAWKRGLEKGNGYNLGFDV